MKVLYFDCFSGISGDMTLGALLDLGIDEEAFRKELEKLNLKGYDLNVEKKTKNSIAGTDVDVKLNEEYEKLQQRLNQQHSHPHPHPHGHEHGHEDDHKHTHDHEHMEAHEHTQPHSHREEEHVHAHAHSHEHDHDSEHGHEHEHEHNHDHEPGHDHECEYDHDHRHVHAHDSFEFHMHNHPHNHGEEEHIHPHEHHHDHGHNHEHDHGHDHDHIHEHDHDHPDEYGHEHNHDHDHGHGHAHTHASGHGHGHSHDDGHGHTHEHHSLRNLKSIEMIIDWSDLTDNVKEMSKKVFREIAKAEAKVHGKPIEEVYFHEVGAVDSIVDIVGTAICLDLLGVQKIYSSPLHDGKGFIKTAHGIIPVPVPAVMEMLADSNIPLITEEVNTELVTPTGMGIIKCLASGFGNMPVMAVQGVGYGLGKRETGRLNALRVVMGTLVEEKGGREDIVLLETNIDDMSPELLGYTMEALFEAGAMDVFHTPIYMKKNRPAVMLTALVSKDAEEKAVDIFLKQTSTLGVRRSSMERYCMNRDVVKVDTGYGEVRVKVASWGDFKKLAPEYEDCKAVAKKSGLPLNRIFDLARKNGEHLV